MIYRWAKTKAWIFDIGFVRMNRKTGETRPGWAPHMLVFCLIAMVIGGAVNLGWQRQWLSWPLFVIDTITSYATQRLVRRSWYRLGRLGAYGASRARWWLELSGLSCTLTMAFGVSALAHGLPGVQFPGAIWIHAFLYHGARFSCFVFLFTATLGMLIGVAQRKQVHGRSIELVAWFYWFFVLIGGMCSVPNAWLLPAGGFLLTLGSLVASWIYFERGRS